MGESDGAVAAETYTLAVYAPNGTDVKGESAEITGVVTKGDLVYVKFIAKSETPVLRFAPSQGSEPR